MKTLFAVTACAALMSASVWAEEATTPASTQEPEYMLKLSVFDMSGKIPKDLNTLDVSRSAKKQQLCWVAKGHFQVKNDVVEEFVSPSKMTVNISPKLGKSVSSKDKKTHTVTTKRDSINDGKIVSACWEFTPSDPRGQYAFTVKINDVTFDTLKFRVTN